MIQLVKPTYNELIFKQELLSDEDTMSFNHKYGGCISFNQERWKVWYEKWILNNNPHYFYRYLYSTKEKCFVGEIAYHLEDNHYLCDVIIHSKYRNSGYGSIGLELLCQCAKENGIKELYDHILIDNPSIHLFLKHNFKVIDQNEEVYIVKKILL